MHANTTAAASSHASYLSLKERYELSRVLMHSSLHNGGTITSPEGIEKHEQLYEALDYLSPAVMLFWY
jgi:hypothetical protein